MITTTTVQTAHRDDGPSADATDADSAISHRDPTDADAEPPEPAEREAITVHASVGLLDTTDRVWLLEHVGVVVRELEASVAQLNVRVLDDAAMVELHRRHLGIDSTTDVLTFHHSGSGEPIEVDIAVCIDVARRQAETRAHDTRRELLLYVLHGLLHCAGFDDRDETDYSQMHAEEDRILTAIGIGAVFDRDSTIEPGDSE